MSSKLLFFNKENDEYKFVVDTDDFMWRSIILYLLLALGFINLLLSTFELQIIKGGEYYQVAVRTNQIQERTLAPRGLIYSSDGVKLANNSPAYSLYVDTSLMPAEREDEILRVIGELIEMDPEILITTYKSKVYDPISSSRIISGRISLKNNLTFDQYYMLLSRIEDLPGIKLNVEAVRSYYSNAFSNIIGYIGDPTQSDVEKGIYSASQIGKTGIEYYYDPFLRGREGLSIEEKEVVSGESTDYEAYEAFPGNNLYLTIDSRWQMSMQEILDQNVSSTRAFGGAAAIVNSRTGEVKALVTNPTYDNNLFAVGISNNDYQGLINDPKRPLFNRPISLQLPPGSIMKVIGATAGLEAGVINENTEKLSDRCMELPGDIVFCEADRSYIGWVNVKEALARSSNLFFCQVMQDLHNKVGYSYYYDIAKSYNLSQKLGIDLPGEASGLIPDESYKLRAINEPWYIGDECNTVIGQGYVTVTPLQMAMVASTVINNGVLVRPYLLSKVEEQSGKIIQESETEVIRDLHVSENTLRIIQEGMEMGVDAGTAGLLKGLPGNPRAKTGSSDAGEWINGKYYSGAHSWVMGCFDYEGETYCFTVMQQWGGRGYRTVPVMKKFINCLYNDFSLNCKNI